AAADAAGDAAGAGPLLTRGGAVGGAPLDDATLPGALDKGGYLHVVRMTTRPSWGERLRSNVQRVGSDTEDTPPPAGDRWVRSLRFNGAPTSAARSCPPTSTRAAWRSSTTSCSWRWTSRAGPARRRVR